MSDDETLDRITIGLLIGFAVLFCGSLALFAFGYGDPFIAIVFVCSFLLLPLAWQCQAIKPSNQEALHEQRLLEAKREKELAQAKDPYYKDPDPDARF